MKKIILLGAACFLLLFIIVGKAKNTTTSQSKITYSGQELFRGIFFQEGNIPKMVPELTRLPSPQKENQSIKNLHKELLISLEKSDPSFFIAFKKNIESGDPKIVEGCLASGQKAIDYQLTSIKKTAMKAISNTAFTGVEKSPAVATGIIVNPPVTMVLDACVVTYKSTAQFEANSLQTEALAFSIAENLKN